MIRFALHSTASPPGVLAALHAHAGEWRESQIPDDLRRAGILTVECQIHDAVGTLRYSRTTRDLGPELSATVAADPTGGTLIEVRVGYRSVPYAAVVAMGLFGAAGAWLFAGSSWAVLPPVMAGGLLAFYIFLVRESNAALLPREREPAYLIDRLERAVVAAGAPQIISPPANER